TDYLFELRSHRNMPRKGSANRLGNHGIGGREVREKLSHAYGRYRDLVRRERGIASVHGGICRLDVLLHSDQERVHDVAAHLRVQAVRLLSLAPDLFELEVGRAFGRRFRAHSKRKFSEAGRDRLPDRGTKYKYT